MMLGGYTGGYFDVDAIKRPALVVGIGALAVAAAIYFPGRSSTNPSKPPPPGWGTYRR